MNAAYSQTNPIAHVNLSDFVTKTATEFGIPGVAVGVWADCPDKVYFTNA